MIRPMLVEITELRPKSSVTDEEFLAADRRVQNEVLPFQPGFLRRTTARGADGSWVTIVLWAEEQYADAAGDTLAPMTDLADEASVRTKRYITLD